jgi:hypothetical protein
MHAVVLLCPYSDSQSSELLSSDTSNPQHKTAHPHHHCLSTPSLPMTARKMIHSIPGPYSKSIIPPRITASAANACGSLLTPKSKAPRRSTVASLGIVREALPILASGDSPVMTGEIYFEDRCSIPPPERILPPHRCGLESATSLAFCFRWCTFSRSSTEINNRYCGSTVFKVCCCLAFGCHC